MKRLLVYLLMSSVLLGGAGTLVAQEKHMPPKVLNITREYVKPGKSGTAHEKTEGAFVAAMRAAQWPTHYLAMDSQTGKPRSLFFVAYDSFEAMEKDTMAMQKNTTLSAAFDRASAADGELLSETDLGDFIFHEEYSMRPSHDIPNMRYFDISSFQVRPGHEKDWDALAKMYVKAAEKIPDAHWVTYEQVYGAGPSGTYIIITPMKSASEIDHNFAEGKDFEAAFGEDGMKKVAELSAAAIESSHSNLFAFNPRMSYVADDWIKADPDFWQPKAAAPAAAKSKKSEEKPAAKH